MFNVERMQTINSRKFLQKKKPFNSYKNQKDAVNTYVPQFKLYTINE